VAGGILLGLSFFLPIEILLPLRILAAVPKFPGTAVCGDVDVGDKLALDILMERGLPKRAKGEASVSSPPSLSRSLSRLRPRLSRFRPRETSSPTSFALFLALTSASRNIPLRTLASGVLHAPAPVLSSNWSTRLVEDSAALGGRGRAGGRSSSSFFPYSFQSSGSVASSTHVTSM